MLKVSQSLLKDHKSSFSGAPTNEILGFYYFEKLEKIKIRIVKCLKFKNKRGISTRVTT